jgi:hypothetical protein
VIGKVFLRHVTTFSAVVVLVTLFSAGATSSKPQKTDRLIVCGEGFVFGVKEPEGWQGDTERARSLMANILFYPRGPLPSNLDCAILIKADRKTNENVAEDLAAEMNDYKKRFSTVRFEEFTVSHPQYKCYPILLVADGDFHDYVAYVNPGPGFRDMFSLGMATGKAPASEAQLDAFRTITASLLAMESYPPIHRAAAEGDIAAVKALLERGADVNARSGGCVTPLHEAALRNRFEVAELLVEKGADVNDKGDSGWTPLHTAASLGHTGMAKLLLEKGANPNAMDDEGGTPLHRVVGMGDSGSEGQYEVAALLVAGGAVVDARTNRGLTPLHMADSKKVAELLITKGAEVNAKANNGETPLHGAAYLGYAEVAELLIAKRADINARSNAGKTPLAMAEEAGKTEMVALLRKRGAK